MTDYKKLSYKLEDTFELGKSLPVVAIRQLPKIAGQFRSLPDHPDYLTKTSEAMARLIDDFVSENKRYIDDERELRQVFVKACKKNRYGHYLLRLFEAR